MCGVQVPKTDQFERDFTAESINLIEPQRSW